MKKSAGLKRIIQANARNLFALSCLGLLVSASLLLPQALILWQDGRILGVFRPQPQQQAQSAASRLNFEEKLSLLSGGVFHSGLQAHFSDPLPYWLDLDYDYSSTDRDYQIAVDMADDVTISPLLTGSRYTQESALSQCWSQLDRLSALELTPPIQRDEPWDVAIQPLLYLSRSAPSHTLIVWQIRLRQGGRQLWISLDDDSGLILYIQQIDDSFSVLLTESDLSEKMALWGQYWGLEMEGFRQSAIYSKKFQTARCVASYLENGEPFLFAARFAPSFCTFGVLTTQQDRQPFRSDTVVDSTKTA